MEITRTPLTRDELECAVELTERLVKLRQNECKHLCVENIGPEIFGKLLAAYFPPLYNLEGEEVQVIVDGLPVSAGEKP